MPIEIRPCPPDRVREWGRAVEVSFGGEGDEGEWSAFERVLERDRILAAFDGDRIVGGGAAYSMRFSIPGGELPGSGIAAVGVLPTHRRQGMTRALMRRQFEDARARHEPLAALWASEGNIYQRFGYGPGTFAGRIEVEQSRSAFLRPIETGGHVTLLDKESAAKRFPPVYEAVRAQRAGLFARSETWWDAESLADEVWRRRGAGPLFYVAYEVRGRDEGYAMYRFRYSWEHTGHTSVLEVGEVMTVTGRAHRALWRFLFDIDLIRVIKADKLPVDDPLLLLVEEPRRLAWAVGDAMWLRLVDVRHALEARGYAADGELLLDVRDAACEWNVGRWRLSAEGGRGRCRPTRRVAELTLDVADLAAVYLGATRFRQLADAGRVDGEADAIVRADRLFAVEHAPWAPQVF